jgi:hypothetical protein
MAQVGPRPHLSRRTPGATSAADLLDGRDPRNR